MPTPPIILVIPCYNEAGRLQKEAFLRALSDYSQLGLYFVNDGSRDRTLEMLQMLATDCIGRATVIHCEKNGGKGEAVRTGMRAACEAGAEWVGYWDADLATPFSELAAFLSAAADRPELLGLLGSRVRMLGRHIERQPKRHYIGRIIATLISSLTGMGIYDSQCGAKLFRNTPALCAALGAPFLSRWLFDVELLLRLQRTAGKSAGDIFRELPLDEWRDVAGSKIRMTDGLPVFRDLYRIVAQHRRLQAVAPRGEAK